MPGPGGVPGLGVPGPGRGAWSSGGCAWWRPSRTATAAGGTHPTGMHSCSLFSGAFTLKEADSDTDSDFPPAQKRGSPWNLSLSLCNVNMFCIVQCRHWALIFLTRKRWNVISLILRGRLKDSISFKGGKI